ncbi:MAG: PAS domain S-box protein [Chloroflexi bacterium]|nr:PAS domain S-box protein [Chloroflexota bacterium]
MGETFNFEHAFILKEDKGNLVVVASTHPAFATTVWQTREFLRRIMTGRSQAVFDINHIPEWLDQLPEIRALATSALYVPLRPQPNAAILVCTHSERSFFTSQHQTLAQRFAPLVAGALQKAELYTALKAERDTLETRVMKRTAELQHERDFGLLVMESMGEGLTITDAEGRLEYVNPAYARILGRTPEEIIGHSPREFTHPQDLEKLDTAWDLRHHGESSTYETRLLSKDTSETEVIVSAVPRYQAGAFAGSIVVTTNVSERAHLERMKTDFINRASHELRTPLATAILMADLLEGGGTEAEQKQFLTVLKNELDRQRLLLNDLLIAGRIESGRIAFNLTPTDIPSLVEEAIASVKPQAEAKKVLIEFQSEPALQMAHSDRQSLVQVLLNLLSNAIKFSHPENSVNIRACNSENGILILVEDHGIGIPTQDLPHIASRFYRAQNATANEIQGTGIGLYIVNGIMKGLRGWMKIESVENKGTTIHVWVPAHK